jgi:F-type H+-transporting ATPase subunit c
MDAMARQPEKISDLRSAMIVAAALVEGVAFFAAIIALLALFV